MDKIIALVLISLIAGAAAGAFTSSLISNNRSQDSLIRDFYLTENAVHVSPHGLRVKMDKGIDDFVLVDLRSNEEYENEHVIGAINIPIYKNKETPAYDEEGRLIEEFSKLPKDKDIIVYCYSIPCMSGRKAGKILAEERIYVKHLGIGWNEWRYSWASWNHEFEWDASNVSDYIASGKEPGIPKIKENTGVCSIGAGC